MGIVAQIGRIAGGPVGNLAFGAFDYASGKAEGEDDIRALAGATGNTAGGWAGGAAGATKGALLGTLLLGPGIGTALGGTAGGIAGGILGSTAGGWLADRGDDLIRGDKGKPISTEQSQLAAYGQGMASGLRSGQAEAIARNYLVNRR